MEAEGNPVCDLCTKRFSPEVCCCGFTVKRVCDRCKLEHLETPGTHVMFPIEMRRFLRGAEEIAEAKQRKKDLNRAEDALYANFLLLEQLRKDVQSAFTRLFNQLNAEQEQCHAVITEMHVSLTREKDEAMKEVMIHLLDSEYAPSSRLAELIRDFTNQSDSESLRLVSGQLTTVDGELLRLTFTRVDSRQQAHSQIEASIPQADPEEQKSTPLLPLFSSDFISFFDPAAQQCVSKASLSKRKLFDNKSSGVVLPDGSVVITGGSKGSQRVVADSHHVTQAGEVTALQSMLVPRAYHGSIAYDGCIYSLGGCNSKDIRSCEKLPFRDIATAHDSHWVKIGDMHVARREFNPCEWEGRIYVCGGMETDLIEVMEPRTGLFEVLGVRLRERKSTCACVVGEEIVVLAWNCVTRWKPGNTPITVETDSDWLVWSNFPPRVVGQNIYVSRAWNKCIFRFDSEALSSSDYPLLS